MPDLIVLIAQTVLTTVLAAWLATGVWDNIRHPANNETFTAQVMGMSRMRDSYPEAFASVAHRAVRSRRVQRLAFALVVLAELAATLVLMAGAGTLGMAMAGAFDPEAARGIALLGATLFTAIWAGFLVVGNYFCYWFCHEWAQNTHFQMTLWGLGTMIFLVVS